MNKETAQLLFMDYLYDELDEDKKNELDAFLSENPDLKKELNELSGARSLLSHLPVQDPAEQLVMVEPDTSGFFDWWNDFIHSLILKSKLAKAGFMIGVCLLLFISAAALTNMNIALNGNGFQLSFGEQPPEQQGFTAEQVEYLINQVKKDNALMVSQVVETAQAEQEQKIQESLVDFAQYMEQQRTSDLRLISSGLSSLEETYYDRFRQTDQVLGEIIQTVSTND